MSRLQRQPSTARVAGAAVRRLALFGSLFASIAASLVATPAAAADVNVSIGIGDPSFYGRLDIGGMAPPPLLYTRPLLVTRGPLIEEPLYLRVPPGHARNWRSHCGRYNACGRRVYFVQDNWYRTVYAPRYRHEHGDRRGDRREYRHDDRRADQRNDHRGDHRGPPGHDRGRDRDRGHDNGHGRGHDKDKH